MPRTEDVPCVGCGRYEYEDAEIEVLGIRTGMVVARCIHCHAPDRTRCTATELEHWLYDREQAERRKVRDARLRRN